MKLQAVMIGCVIVICCCIQVLSFGFLKQMKIGNVPSKLSMVIDVPRAKPAQFKLTYPSVFLFGKGMAKDIDDTKEMKNILGGKGINLALMSSLGLSVPPGFTVTTEVCNEYHKAGKQLPDLVWKDILESLQTLEKTTNRKLGDASKPLLVSVRSGAAISMPGMMDTILNLGINDVTVVGLAKTFGGKFAWDSYRRLLNMFGTVVFDIPHFEFENQMKQVKSNYMIKDDTELTEDHLKELVEKYKNVYLIYRKTFPQDTIQQLYVSILAVFNSWYSERALLYREKENIVGLLGTAVNIQAMVFGNMGETSGTGVCFTRNPNNGNHELYGEYLMNAQGEDVVAGIRTPTPIVKLQENMPQVYNELMQNVEILEKYYHDMQDIEFTVQEGQLYMLQTRGGKRNGRGAIKIAVDMVRENIATTDQAIMTVKPEHLKQLLHPEFKDVKAPTYRKAVIASGLAASPGAAVGKIVFTPEDAEVSHASGEPCILVREDTSPEDVGGMYAAEGILTATGGYTSHASVVARGWGKPCICGCSALKIDSHNKILTIKVSDTETVKLSQGDWISINGDTGEVLIGKHSLSLPTFQNSGPLTEFMSWVDSRRKLKVLANADTPKDAEEARKYGAEGIGLTRTEHMFFADDRINVVRRMILAQNEKSRQVALDELLEFQRIDFEHIFEAMDDLPVTVRLLDPPLHEFLPRVHPDDKVTPSSTDFIINEEFAKQMNLSIEEIIFAIKRLEEVNPMLGLRGCRLGIVIPELVEMQARAIIEAALNNKYKRGLNPIVEIMIPLIGSVNEYVHQSSLIQQTFDKVLKERTDQTIKIKIGTMIEVPRAALTAEDIAKAGAEFFSYGTNDLTQMTYGFSRDDVGSFLPAYLKKNILEEDPFESIDVHGVGKLIELSSKNGQAAAFEIGNKHFKYGICGEHGGDPKSVKYFSKIGMNYVSCSPYRIPLARLAAAQAAIEYKL